MIGLSLAGQGAQEYNKRKDERAFEKSNILQDAKFEYESKIQPADSVTAHGANNVNEEIVDNIKSEIDEVSKSKGVNPEDVLSKIVPDEQSKVNKDNYE